jgi:hypothetical protein
LKPLPEYQPADFQDFHQEIVAQHTPVVIRGATADWAAVQRGKQSPTAILDYLKEMDRGNQVYTIAAPPEAGGRFFYRNDLKSVNFRRGQIPLAQVLQQLQTQAQTPTSHAIAVQAMPVREMLPAFEGNNRMPLLDANIEPTMWIGTPGKVAPHYDIHRNLACVVAGRRQFVLYPPEQAANLYPGPGLDTPGGVPVSLVDPSNPDLHRFPRYTEASAAAKEATLYPGDAIYIPALWWHGVDSLDPVNVLVNYWWGGMTASGVSPNDSLLHSMLTIAGLDEAQRRAWKEFFDYYVFRLDDDPTDHLPDDLKDIVTSPDPEQIKQLRIKLAQNLKPSDTGAS